MTLKLASKVWWTRDVLLSRLILAGPPVQQFDRRVFSSQLPTITPPDESSPAVVVEATPSTPTTPPPPPPSQPPQERPSGSSSSSSYRRAVSRRDYRFIFPEFLPDPDHVFRNQLVEKLTRKDMLKRRDQVEIPEFYVGSVMAVTIADPSLPSPNKESRFLGLCIARGGTGTRAYIILRNVIDGQGIEFMYHLYAPQIQKIETIRLEKRLDDELYYLRDAPHEYYTFKQDMEAEILPEGTPVPINETVVRLKPKPWNRHWERYADRLSGFTYDSSTLQRHEQLKLELDPMFMNMGWHREVLKYDLMLQYRETIPIEEQDAIWAEVGDALEDRDRAMRKVAAKRSFAKPTKRM